MPSQFFGLNIAYTGLLANNAALNTTSNNIANAQTEGFSRQHVVQQASNALRVFQTYGCAGAGVDTLAIERIRDEFYDQKYWRNNTNVGEYEIKEYYMKQIETYFDDDGIATGFNTIFTKFMNTGLQELMKDPNSDTAKAQFIGCADALTEFFNNLSGNLQATQKDVNKELKLKVDEINSLAGEISTLNGQINVIELTGVKANELRDRRTLLLDQLSEIVDIQTSETPIIDPYNPEHETGANRFVVKIAAGQVLVDNTEYNRLECVARPAWEKVNLTDIDGLYDIYWENGTKFNLYNAAMGGSLHGLVQMRDGNNGENFKGMVSAIGTDANGNDTVTVEVSKSYLQDLNKCNLSDQGGIITLGNREFYYDSWSYSCSLDANGDKVYSYTFTLSDSTKNTDRLTNDRVGKEASTGSTVNYQGIPYYMNQMNEWVRTFAQKFNDILTSGYDGYGNKGTPLLTGDNKTDGTQYIFDAATRYDTLEPTAGNPVVVKVDDISYYRLTADNFAITSAMITDPSLLANRKDAADGVEQNDLLEELKTMAYDKEKLTFRGSSASEFLQCILSDVTLNASRANVFYKNFTGIQDGIDIQRMSIYGVDEDEEALNLVKYQNGYNLASKMIQTLTEIYDRLILQTGV